MTRRMLPWLADVVAPVMLVAAVVVIGVCTQYPAWWISLQVIATLVAAAYLVTVWWLWPRSGTSATVEPSRPGSLAAAAVADDDDAVMLRRRRRSVWLSVSMAAVVIAASAGAIAASLCGTASRDAQVDHNRRELPAIADRLVTTVFSYDAGHRPADRAAAARFVTGDFAETFFAPSADPNDTTTVHWQPAKTALVEVGRSTATVTIAANVTETMAGAAPSTTGKVVVLQLVLADGGWKIADVRSIL